MDDRHAIVTLGVDSSAAVRNTGTDTFPHPTPYTLHPTPYTLDSSAVVSYRGTYTSVPFTHLCIFCVHTSLPPHQHMSIYTSAHLYIYVYSGAPLHIKHTPDA